MKGRSSPFRLFLPLPVCVSVSSHLCPSPILPPSSKTINLDRSSNTELTGREVEVVTGGRAKVYLFQYCIRLGFKVVYSKGSFLASRVRGRAFGDVW